MNRSVIFVAIGGMIGTVCRYFSVSIVAGILPFTFPFGTFAVNIIGCFIMGAALGLAEHSLWLDRDWRAFVTAGFCGGFTTFSAFAFENVELLMDKNYSTFIVYSSASFVVCLAAAFGGFVLLRN